MATIQTTLIKREGYISTGDQFIDGNDGHEYRIFSLFDNGNGSLKVRALDIADSTRVITIFDLKQGA